MKCALRRGDHSHLLLGETGQQGLSLLAASVSLAGSPYGVMKQ